MEEVVFLYHEPCPKCGSRDNVGVYSDGHKWCFGCGYYVPPSGASKKALEPVVDKPAGGIYLPDDCEPYYPYKCLHWVHQYGLSDVDLRANRVVWSEYSQLLIFPLLDEDKTLLGWQGRNFGDKYKVKWFGRGKLDDILVFKGTYDDPLILVEDIISAIVLGKNDKWAMPLFGSSVSTKRLVRLKLITNQLVIWLDHDKANEAHKFVKQAQRMGFEAKSVITYKDPKYHTLDEINEII